MHPPRMMHVHGAHLVTRCLSRATFLSTQAANGRAYLSGRAVQGNAHGGRRGLNDATGCSMHTPHKHKAC